MNQLTHESESFKNQGKAWEIISTIEPDFGEYGENYKYHKEEVVKTIFGDSEFNVMGRCTLQGEKLYLLSWTLNSACEIIIYEEYIRTK